MRDRLFIAPDGRLLSDLTWTWFSRACWHFSRELGARRSGLRPAIRTRPLYLPPKANTMTGTATARHSYSKARDQHKKAKMVTAARPPPPPCCLHPEQSRAKKTRKKRVRRRYPKRRPNQARRKPRRRKERGPRSPPPPRRQKQPPLPTQQRRRPPSLRSPSQSPVPRNPQAPALRNANALPSGRPTAAAVAVSAAEAEASPLRLRGCGSGGCRSARPTPRLTFR